MVNLMIIWSLLTDAPAALVGLNPETAKLWTTLVEHASEIIVAIGGLLTVYTAWRNNATTKREAQSTRDEVTKAQEQVKASVEEKTAPILTIVNGASTAKDLLIRQQSARVAVLEAEKVIADLTKATKSGESNQVSDHLVAAEAKVAELLKLLEFAKTQPAEVPVEPTK